MFGALLYLRFVSLWNAALSRVRRLRQPKYLVGAIAGASYFYFLFLRRFTAASGGFPGGAGLAKAGITRISVAGGSFAAAGALLAAAYGIICISLAWAMPAADAGLGFSEAEIAFLFPAPVSRRMLIHFRLLSAQFKILLSSVVLAMLTRRFVPSGGSLGLGIAGAWILLSIFDLHITGTSLTLTKLRERGAYVGRWRAGAFIVIGLYAATLLGSAYVFGHAPSPRELSFPSGLLDYLRSILESGPLPWLLLPFKVATGPFMALGMRAFLAAMIPALAVLALHYLWIMRMEAAFEEGSIAAAARRAAARSALGRGGLAPLTTPTRNATGGAPARARGEPFRMAHRGRPEIAFLWKNILSMQNALANPRVLRAALILVVALVFGLRALVAGHTRAGRTDFTPIILGGSAMLAFYTLLLGPQLARQDLRSDLPNVDVLKTYPLPGWQLALGELLAPTAILTSLLWLAILVPAVALGSGVVGWFTPAFRAVAAACLGVIAPLLCMIQLLVPNTLMVLFPGWYQASRSRGGGIEVMGQRMIFVFGQMIVAVIAIAPAAIAAGVLIFASQWLIGPSAAVVLATTAVLAILGGEAAVGLWWLGDCFEKLDLSSELRP